MFRMIHFIESLKVGPYRLIFNGENWSRADPELTLSDYGLQDGDELYFMVEQMGD